MDCSWVESRPERSDRSRVAHTKEHGDSADEVPVGGSGLGVDAPVGEALAAGRTSGGVGVQAHRNRPMPMSRQRELVFIALSQGIVLYKRARRLPRRGWKGLLDRSRATRGIWRRRELEIETRVWPRCIGLPRGGSSVQGGASPRYPNFTTRNFSSKRGASSVLSGVRRETIRALNFSISPIWDLCLSKASSFTGQVSVISMVAVG